MPKDRRRGKRQDQNFRPTEGTSQPAVLEQFGNEIDDSPDRDSAAVSPYLLDRLLYKGVLPRYAFPTDVATFYVFDLERSTAYSPAFRYTPSQGLNIALSQYAPGKDVWINNKLFFSGAVYSPMSKEVSQAWINRRLYYECRICHYAKTIPLKDGSKNDLLDCPACREVATFGPARTWMRPPGFSHPVHMKERTSGDEPVERSFATRAKLMANSDPDPTKWVLVAPNVRHYHLKEHLLVTNRGPREEGYHYCTSCGAIEPAALPQPTVLVPHPKPFPAGNDMRCDAGYVARNVVLGTDFITDVLLISVTVAEPYSSPRRTGRGLFRPSPPRMFGRWLRGRTSLQPTRSHSPHD